MTQELTEKAKKLIQHEVREYLNHEDIKFHEEVVRELHWVINDYFREIKKILLEPHSDVNSLEFSKSDTMDAMYILAQCVLEDVLPKVYLKPEWVRDTDWKRMLTKKENTNDTTNME